MMWVGVTGHGMKVPGYTAYQTTYPVALFGLDVIVASDAVAGWQLTVTDLFA